MDEHEVPWWEHWDRCCGLTKSGHRCKNHRRQPYEIELGNLYLPMTCWQHRGQEVKLRRLARRAQREKR